MTIAIPVEKVNIGNNGLAFHNSDGTITINLPAPSVTISRETADALAAYLLKETN